MEYKFTGKTIEHKGITLKQIVRIKDQVIGGYVEKVDSPNVKITINIEDVYND